MRYLTQEQSKFSLLALALLHSRSFCSLGTPVAGRRGAHNGLMTKSGLTLHQTPLHHKWKLWTLSLLSAVLEPRLHIFQNWFKDHGTLQTKKYNSIQIKIIHSLVRVLENSFSEDMARIPLPLVTEEFYPPTPPATVWLTLNYPWYWEVHR